MWLPVRDATIKYQEQSVWGHQPQFDPSEAGTTNRGRKARRLNSLWPVWSNTPTLILNTGKRNRKQVKTAISGRI